ncbi:hypothetical protein Lqui_0510 [Legionella quinlivanii]|uniref:Uncharacterized protein n=1 Tax=Legionella quinlivanii TaxID=45073 RepID=A0A0W0Y4T4_9GAMM|nr:hypothetical protein [Legionella quinlivanii]KTD51666.1 hypothetical protein Lqui_0510 [Legionella quinlivanii]SEF62411.1 hypothetical protein SAMN02746093_00649 [Legionella quinlivanii DSM 21216]STY10807.1 Uncharacterised protein [Legionella quinlivanii]
MPQESDEQITTIENGSSYNTFNTPTSSRNYFGRLKQYASTLNLTNCLPASDTLKSYVPSWSSVAYGSAAILTTLPFLPYCFTSRPQAISEEWWDSKSRTDKWFLIINAIIFMSIGTGTRTRYYHEMVDNLKKILGSYFGSLSGFSYRTAILLISAISAMPAAALGYFGAIWAGTIAAIFSSLSSFANTCALRIVFIPNFIQTIKNWFDEDRIFQKELAYQLSCIKPESLSAINSWITEEFSNKELDEQLVKIIVKRIYQQELAVLDVGESHFYKPGVLARAMDCFKSCIPAGVSGFFSISFFLLISQAGFDGFKLFCQALSERCTVDDLKYIVKLSVSFIPGLTAAIVAFMSSNNFFQQIIKDVYRHISNKPRDVIKVLVIAGCCLITAVALYNAAKSIADKPNLYQIKTEAETFEQLMYLHSFLTGNYSVGLILDLGACLKLAGLTETQNNTPDVKAVVHWLNRKELSSASVSNIREHGFFSQSRTKQLSTADVEMQPVAACNLTGPLQR